MNKPVINSEVKEMAKNALDRLPSRDITDLFGMVIGTAGIGGLLYIFLHRK